MEGRMTENTIYYEAKPHHRQQLRALIKPDTIDRLEINDNPSGVSRMAYKSLFKDQLEKEMEEHQNMKARDQNICNQGLKTKMGKSNSGLAYPTLQGQRSKSLFRDYDMEKTIRNQAYIDRNYDGGSGFFKASDEWNNTQKNRYRDVREGLQKQVENKSWLELNRKHQKQRENQDFQTKMQSIEIATAQHKSQEKKMRMKNGQENLRLLQEQQRRKQRNSSFQYNNQTRHNPITNPIEYHIDNPYILKRIQQKSGQLRI